MEGENLGSKTTWEKIKRTQGALSLELDTLLQYQYVSATSPSCDPIMKSIISVILSIVKSLHNFSNKKLNMLPLYIEISTSTHTFVCALLTMPCPLAA